MTKFIVANILLFGLIYLIFNRAIGNLRLRRRWLLNLIFGLFLTSLFVIAFFIDYQKDALILYRNYLIYSSINFVYTIGITVYYLIIIFGNPFDRKIVTSKVYYQEYIYLVYHYQKDYYLVKKKHFYQGVIIKLKKTDFQDDVIKKLIKQKNISTYGEPTKIGQLTVNENKQIYYCYIIDLQETLHAKKFEAINGYQIQYLNLKPLDKNIIYRIIIRDPFEIEE